MHPLARFEIVAAMLVLGAPALADGLDDRHFESSTPALTGLGFRDWTLRLLGAGPRSPETSDAAAVFSLLDPAEIAWSRSKPPRAHGVRMTRATANAELSTPPLAGEPDANAGAEEREGGEDRKRERVIRVSDAKHRTTSPLHGARAVPAELRLSTLPGSEDTGFAIVLEIPSTLPATLNLYDVAGRRLDALDIPFPVPGARIVSLDPIALPPGVYFAVLSQAERRAVLKLARR